MAEARVRRDIWNLEEEAGGPWHPITDAYARAVGVMKARAADDSTSWAFQAAIHGQRGGDWRQQCQHFCWYFLPWHRLYLYWFEAIVRAAIEELEDVDYDVKEAWALPYWNYSRGGKYATLPTAFREEKLADGTTDNPLFAAQRNAYVNAASEPMPDRAITALPALSQLLFAQEFVGGFGGAPTGKNHTNQAAGAVMGSLEGTPHGAVHVEVGGRGGLMSAFDTAGLDACFWLHHCNIDRLWEVWRTQDGTADPSDARWTDETFEFHDAGGAVVSGKAADVLDTQGQLGYSYEDISMPPLRRALEAAVPEGPPPDHPPELVGASDEAVEITGGPASVSFPVGEAQGPGARRGLESAAPQRVYLNVEGIEGEQTHGVTYGVYLNLPDDEDPDSDPERHHVGNVSFFGVEESTDVDSDHPEGHGLRYAFDITDTVAQLRDAGQWDASQLKVTFAPLREEAGLESAAPPIRVGRVGLYLQ